LWKQIEHSHIFVGGREQVCLDADRLRLCSKRSSALK
jgi:hypothetical protein